RGSAVDLTQLVGQDVRISFDAELPGYFVFGLFQLDNVALHNSKDVPVIVSAPAALRVYEGEPAVLSVTATNPESLTYQWIKDGVNIPGATKSSYTIEA